MIDNAKFQGMKYRLYQLIDEQFNIGVGFKIVRIVQIDWLSYQEKNPMYFMRKKSR